MKLKKCNYGHIKYKPLDKSIFLGRFLLTYSNIAIYNKWLGNSSITSTGRISKESWRFEIQIIYKQLY